MAGRSIREWAGRNRRDACDPCGKNQVPGAGFGDRSEAEGFGEFRFGEGPVLVLVVLLEVFGCGGGIGFTGEVFLQGQRTVVVFVFGIQDLLHGGAFFFPGPPSPVLSVFAFRSAWEGPPWFSPRLGRRDESKTGRRRR